MIIIVNQLQFITVRCGVGIVKKKNTVKTRWALYIFSLTVAKKLFRVCITKWQNIIEADIWPKWPEIIIIPLRVLYRNLHRYNILYNKIILIIKIRDYIFKKFT